MRMRPDEVRIWHDILTDTRCRDTFFVRTPMIVLILDFQKRRVRILVYAQTDLLPHLAPSLVLGKHVTIGGIEITSVIWHVAQPADLLHAILHAGHLQQPDKI